MIGSGPNPVAFSFYATKNLTTAEGGMLTGAPDFLERASIFALHGMTRDAWKRYGKEGSWYYEVTVPGFKYNMTDIQASLGLHQLKNFQSFTGAGGKLPRGIRRSFPNVKSSSCPWSDRT